MKHLASWSVSFFSAALVLSGCGGGSDKDAVCANFTYQQDAQAAYRAGATQLDGDKDGIACEALPNRPSSGTTIQPSATYSPYNFLTGTGTLVQLRPSFGAYSLSYAKYGEEGMDTGPLAPVAAGGGLEVATSNLSLRYFKVSDATLMTWSPSRYGYAATTGVGVESTGSVALTDIVGAYKLLGQRCSPSTKMCSLAFGTASIAANGTFALCATSIGYSGGCNSRTLSPADPLANNIAAVWSIEGSDGNLIASKTRGTVAFSYRDNRLDKNDQPYSADTFTFFGQLDGVTAGTAIGATTMVSFDAAGQLRTGVPAESQWGVTAGLPMAGFFQDGPGNTYLHSTTGQLISWTVGSGLRHYSKP